MRRDAHRVGQAQAVQRGPKRGHVAEFGIGQYRCEREPTGARLAQQAQRQPPFLLKADDGRNPRALAREFLTRADVISMRFEPGALVVETGKPDEFYENLTDLVAGGQFGAVEELTSPDDNLQAVFKYLVKT